ncbi:hypothetical protein [Roseimicrobium sp. ORNL1]|uniref:hypothetical protein n=1 Tax=Roseimicrobium sp. ORNL1 TaxID=2711231 RepID=UPI0013E1FBDC|nr:hypothetical protein [Roseimicrobium sp. ORNL1]QIF00790.1 hypothetical protein G5S37_04375 [Roseimicrobium sp. ORNL1]
MNESEFESSLRRFTPVKPSPDLAQGIATSLERSVSVPGSASRRASAEPASSLLWVWLDRLLWSTLGATAAVAVTLTVVRPAPVSTPVPAPTAEPTFTVTQHAPPPVAPAASDFQKVLTSNETLDWKDEGIHFDSTGQPVLKLRRTAVEHQAWADIQNAGVVQVEVPRQEVMYVPVPLH